MNKFIITMMLFLNTFVLSNENWEKEVAIWNDAPISKLICINFLRKRKLTYAKTSWADDSVADNVFGKFDDTIVTLHEAKMVIRREGFGEAESVIIETFVWGSNKEFEFKELLDSEQSLLKHILIKTYSDKLAALKKEGIEPLMVCLDKYTKVISLPENVHYVVKDYWSRESERIDDTRKGMNLITIIPAAEFEILINEYFIDKPKIKENPTEIKEAKQKSRFLFW